jgi:hypothetical protein
MAFICMPLIFNPLRIACVELAEGPLLFPVIDKDGMPTPPRLDMPGGARISLLPTALDNAAGNRLIAVELFVIYNKLQFSHRRENDKYTDEYNTTFRVQ